MAGGGKGILAEAETGDEAEEAAAGGAELGGDVMAVEEDCEARISGEDADEDVPGGDAIRGGGEGNDLEGEYEGEHMRYR